MRKLLLARKFSVLLFMSFFLILSFQNCSKDVVFHQDTSQSLKNENTDDGRPYEGKIFVLFGNVCPDGTNLKARIVVQSAVAAQLVRQDCSEITPVALGPTDFQINPQNENELSFQNEIYSNTLVGTKLDLSIATSDGGFAYKINGVFGPEPDTTTSLFLSTLQVYEDGKPLGPAHTGHPDIRDFGMGRFSHRTGAPVSPGTEALRWSSSDNTDPRTNGRTYTWDVRQ